MTEKVDVVVNIYGKPYQTIATLRSLYSYSAAKINNLLLICEKVQPYNFDLNLIKSEFENTLVFIPNQYKFQHSKVDLDNPDQRLSVRYQWGFESGTQRCLFITHNDVLYTGDVIGEMLNEMGDSVGVGRIGQCWNCPAGKKRGIGLCSGENFGNWVPNYDEVVSLLSDTKPIRTTLDMIDKDIPFPLPECRLNEWACLVDRQRTNLETLYLKRAPLFGLSSGLDIGTAWFRQMVLLGYKFRHFNRLFEHGYWADTAGHVAEKDQRLNAAGEARVREYLQELERLSS